MVNEVSIPSLRNYEVSIWTLQDRFLSVLKWFNLEQKGQIQEPQITLKDDGTQNFNFSIPKFYKVGNDNVLNPMWHQITEQPLIANMHKLKVIFNKNIGQETIDDLDTFVIRLNNLLLDLFDQPFNYTTEDFVNKNINEILLIVEVAIKDFSDAEVKFLKLKRELNLEEVILEFLVVSVTEQHSEDNIMIDVSAEGLAFHELGKIGYKIALSKDDFLNDLSEWFETKPKTEAPQQDIHYWNKKIFGEDDNLITNWKYRVEMDWSAHSQAKARLSTQVYEDEYVSSWQAEGNEMVARYVEGLRVKWRSIDVKESNIYNITQTIAETFGVFCRYEYEYDVNYQIIGRTVVYYNNYVRDRQNHFDLTYPYSTSSIQRITDSSNITTKMYVRAVDNDSQGAETITIMDVDANKSKEDYLLNFDYLYKIGTITEEQYEEIKNYETRLFIINSQLYRIKERMDIVSAELTRQEAKQKTAADALQLDEERKLAAQDALSALTDDEGELPYEKTFVAIPATDREGYYYISAPVKGIKENTIHLYAEYDMALKQPKASSEIFGFSIIRDEFGEVDKIGFSSSSEIRTGWMHCKYDPHFYYEQVIAAWDNRSIIDSQDYENSTAEIRKLKYWLYGTLVDFARVDETYTDNEYMEAAYCDGIVRLDTHEVVFSEVDRSRAVSEEDIVTYYDENTGLVDMTEINDIIATPNLYYNYQYYLRYKSEIINAFNRMMGPALREGYWQPENYNDYGDVYKDKFLLYPHQDGKNRHLENYDKPAENGHVSFMWDWKKQYDNEEPFIYQSTVDGKMEQHIAINLTKSMDLIKDHAKDLTFFYYDVGVVQTIYEVQQKIAEYSSTLYTKEEDGQAGVDCAALKSAAQSILNQTENTMSSITNTNSRYALNDLISFCENIKNNITGDELQNNVIFSKLPVKTLQEMSEKLPLFIEEATKQQTRYQDYADVDMAAISFYNQYWEKLNQAMTDAGVLVSLGGPVSDIKILENKALLAREKAMKKLQEICANTQIFNPPLNLLEVQTNCAIYAERQYINDQQVGFKITFRQRVPQTRVFYYQSQTSLYSSLASALSTINNQVNIMINRRDSLHLQIQYDWIAQLVKNGLRSLTVGSQCELGWIIDADTMLDNEGNVISEPIPVLILTDAKNLGEKTIKYLATGMFNYEYYTGDEVHGIEYNTREINLHQEMPEYQPFLGYYNITKDSKDVVTNVETITLSGVNIRDIIYETIQPNGKIYPKFNTYHYRKVYPRLYFDTLKLKNKSDELYIQLNGQNLKDNEDYYTVTDDRSQGLKVLGVGYYTTLKPHTLYRFGAKQVMIDILYTLSNADVAIYLDAVAVMRENAFPKVSYNVELSVLNPEIIKNAYNCLTQIVSINDTDLQLEDVNGYISSITMSLDMPWEDQVEIKNYETKFEDLFSTIVAQTEAMKKSEGGLNTAISAFSSDGLIKSYILQNSIRSANLQQLYYGGKLTISEEDGILATADNNAGVVAIRGNGIFTATEKDSNGDWKWNTGILPSGINANLITTGQLDTNLIRIFSGDDLSFQWDGDGLYAYRSIYDNTILNENDEQQEIMDTNASLAARTAAINNNNNKSLDYKQYVKFDGTGLSLVAEDGVFVPKRLETTDGIVSYIYNENPLQASVERVKIGWNGLILRNWDNERTLYADPDTGNLIISGTITATAGQIGAWHINTYGLSNNNQTLLLSAGDNNIPPGIFLGTTPMASTFIFGGKTYFEYTDDADRVYYNEEFQYGETGNVTPGNFIQNSPFYTKNDDEIIVVKPKYTVTEVRANIMEGEGEETYDGDVPTEGSVDIEITSTTTVIYITDDKQKYIKKSNGEYLIYDNNTSPDAQWYRDLKNIFSSNNGYEAYVDIIKGTTMRLADPQPERSRHLKASGEKNAKLTITAATDANGETDVTILGGKVGNFNITKDGLTSGSMSGSKIDTTNIIQHDGQAKYNVGACICDINVDAASGIMTITHANGQQQTFNLAAMAFYKEAVAAAGKLSLDLRRDGDTVTATASSGLASTTKTLTIPVSSGGGGGGSSGGGGGSSSCGSCSASCGNVCVSNCSGCKGGCKTGCSGTSKGGGCFAPGTLVSTCDNSAVPIESLHMGDKVLAYDEAENKPVPARVVDLVKYRRKQLVKLILSNGKSIMVTTSHPLLSTRGWISLDLERSIIEHCIRTKKMEIGDELIALDKEPVILEDIIYYNLDNETDVYNLILDHYHTFFAEGVVAHNINTVVSSLK